MTTNTSEKDRVSSTNKTDRHDITEILLKVALNTIHPQIVDNIPLRVTLINFDNLMFKYQVLAISCKSFFSYIYTSH
jgi:hypothetical protein